MIFLDIKRQHINLLKSTNAYHAPESVPHVPIYFFIFDQILKYSSIDLITTKISSVKYKKAP